MKSSREFKSDESYNKYLRRYYAGLAMQGLCANTVYSLNEIKQGGCCDITEVCVVLADQLIKDLKIFTP